MNNYIKDEECLVSLGGTHIKGVRPAISHECFGLVKDNNEYILFEEDDGHFWDVVVLSEDQLEYLKSGIIELHKSMISKKGDLFKFRFKNGIPKIKSRHFNLHYDMEDYFIKLIKLTVNNKDISVHPCYMAALVKCLKLTERDS